MSKKMHTTANGVPFDMAAFRAKNEKVRAVGNMNVNARGDVLDSNNNVIESRPKIVNRTYEKVTQSGVRGKGTSSATAKPGKILTSETTPDELMNLDDDLPNPKKG